MKRIAVILAERAIFACVQMQRMIRMYHEPGNQVAASMCTRTLGWQFDFIATTKSKSNIKEPSQMIRHRISGYQTLMSWPMRNP